MFQRWRLPEVIIFRRTFGISCQPSFLRPVLTDWITRKQRPAAQVAVQPRGAKQPVAEQAIAWRRWACPRRVCAQCSGIHVCQGRWAAILLCLFLFHVIRGVYISVGVCSFGHFFSDVGLSVWSADLFILYSSFLLPVCWCVCLLKSMQNSIEIIQIFARVQCCSLYLKFFIFGWEPTKYVVPYTSRVTCARSLKIFYACLRGGMNNDFFYVFDQKRYKR
jgi:hypothetical protein